MYTEKKRIPLNVIDAGREDYRITYARQRELFDTMTSLKQMHQSVPYNNLILVEHNPVYTLGVHGDSNNMLLAQNDLKQKGIELIHTERGGDITFHGPGQLVAYPVVDLESLSLGVKDYISLLEQTVKNLLLHYGIRGESIDNAPGVWIGKNTSDERKICAVGVKCRRYVTMHGIALNVNTDLRYFSAINPCGFKDKNVTSIEREIGKTVDFEELKHIFTWKFRQLFD